ncbi:fimbrial protein [Enterobacter sp. DRP3]|nr:fimbrial protein [Enterobacter sp. DRP3]
MYKSGAYAAMMAAFLLLHAAANAAQTGDSYTFKLTGRLVKSSWCTVNNDQPITVNFGNVGVTKVASGQYVQNIQYTLQCQDVTGTSTMAMTLKATASGWDPKAMSTDVSDLGVYILKDGQTMALNTPVAITPGSVPKLQAQLTQNPDTTLPEKAFKATGTLVVEYK